MHNQIDVASEKVLLKRLRANDRTAFEEVARRYQARVYNLHCWMTGNPSLAEDLTQETFVAVWRGLDGFEGRSGLYTWIYRIARNVALSHLRKPKVETVEMTEVDRTQDTDTTAQAASQGLLREAVRDALTELPPEQREALILNKLCGLSHSQVAEILDRPLGTIKWHITAGLQGLRQALERKGITGSEV